MRRTRAFVAAMFAALSLSFFALLTRAVYEGIVVGDVAQSTLSMLIMVGFMIVSGVAVAASQGRMAQLAAHRCHVCGSTVYATVRSFDRRPMLTCFTCGHEVLTT